MPSILIAECIHEVCSFNPVPTRYADFAVQRGARRLRRGGRRRGSHDRPRGKLDREFSRPVRVTGKVAATSHGVTVDLRDRGVCDLGRTALLRVGSIWVVLLGHRSFAINHPVLYAHLGLDVADAKMVVVKTASNFQFFARWRSGLIRVDSPGTTQSDLTAFSWKRLPRPIYPLDALTEWRA